MLLYMNELLLRMFVCLIETLFYSCCFYWLMMDVTETSLITGIKNIEEKSDDNIPEPNSPTDKDENKFSNSSGKGMITL